MWKRKDEEGEVRDRTRGKEREEDGKEGVVVVGKRTRIPI